ncbi:hypothetical protein [Mycobacterium sp. MMS18-G62]
MINKLWVCAFVVLFGLALTACHTGQEARADAPEANLNEPFALGGGQEAVIASENLRVRFEQVLEDSRCPARVKCVWTGQARIAVVVQPNTSVPSTVTFNTNPAPGQTVDVVAVGEYTIELQSLDPYPQSPEDPIPFEDYRATLVVRKA